VIPRTCAAVVDWTRDLLLPSAVRLHSYPFDRFGKYFGFSWSSRLHAANAALALLLASTVVLSISRENLRRAWPLLVLMPGAVVAYVGVISLGRDAKAFKEISYYLYFFGLFMTILTYALVDFSKLRSWRGVVAFLILTVFIVLHGTGSVATTREVERVNRNPSLYMTRVIRFVDAHKHEPGFSFGLMPHPETLEGYPDQPNPVVHRRRASEILFAKYYDTENPKPKLAVTLEIVAK
jgi:hypothetical protein